MNAYPKSSIEAITIADSLQHWKENNLVGVETTDKISRAYPKSLYTPNFFIRIALFAFTCILTSASFGLITLIFQGGWSDTALATRFIIYAILAFAALELSIMEKRPYRAGIDDALLYTALGLLLTGIGMVVLGSGNHAYDLPFFFLLSFPILVFAAIRYVDMLVAAAAYCCLFATVFYHILLAGTFIQILLPFVGMALSVFMYFQSRKFQEVKYMVWWNNLYVLEFLSLLSFYLSGNYFVVRELSIELMDLNLSGGSDIPLAYVFYAFTLFVPVYYLYRSVKTKDRMMLRTGLLIFGIAVLTFKYYFSLGHHEITITLAGIIMVAAAWALTRYLKTPQYGFTSQEDKSIMNTDIEAYVISETMKKGETSEEFNFGGGRSGGAGAGGQF